LTILFNRGADLSLRQEFLSGFYDLSFFESHWEYYVSLNTGAESNARVGYRTQGIECSSD
jgi:hypothetical protein